MVARRGGARVARGKIGPLSVARLKPGDTLWDTEIARFGARCRTNGTTYFIKPRIGGTQRWLTIGRHGLLTPAEARARARQLLGEIDAGRDPTREREARRTMPSLAVLAERWLRDHVAIKRKPRTLGEYRRLVRKHLTPDR